MPAFSKTLKNTIVISGYFGFDNTGDEAVLASVVQTIKQDIPEANIIALSANPALTAKHLQIEAVQRDNFRAVWRALGSARLFISGGGSLFQDITSVGSVVYYAMLIYMAWFRKVPIMVLAQGLGPLRTGLGKWITKRALKKAKALTWRDEASFTLAKELGVKEEKMFLTCDPVLCWQPEKVTVPLLPPGKKVAFCLRPWPNLNRRELAETMDKLMAKNYNIVLLPLQKEVDDVELAEIESLMQGTPWHIRALGAEGIWQILADVDFVVSMRLHALIMAAALKVPAAAISYDPKVLAFAKQAGQPVIAEVEHLDAEKLVLEIEQFMQNPTVGIDGNTQALWQVSRDKLKALYEQNN